MRKIIEFTYTARSCKLLISEDGNIKLLEGKVHIPKELGFHEYGHAIRQLLVDKYGFNLSSVYKPLDTATFNKSKISGLQL